MIATKPVNIGSLIARNGQIRGGRPIIAGTGVTVERIVRWHQLGLTPEEIAGQFGHLSLAQVHAALAYYHANRDAIDESISEEDAAAQEIEQHYLLAVKSAGQMRDSIEFLNAW